MWNSITNIALITSVVASSVVAARIIFSRNRSTQNVLLFLTIIFSVAWSIFLFLTIVTSNFWIAKASFAVSAFIPCCLIIFILYFTDIKNKKKFSIIAAVPSIIMAAICFIDKLLFEQISVSSNYISIDKTGILLTLFYAYFSIYSITAFILAIYSFKNLHGIKKLQLKFVIFGALISLFLASFVNLMLPMFGVYQYNGLGPSFTLILAVAIYYAFTKHNLLNSKVFLSEIWSFIALLSILFWFLLQPNISNLILLLILSATSTLLILSTNGEAKKLVDIEKMAKQLEQDKHDLMDLDRMKDEFLQMATHELNTPITVIQGKLSMAIEEDMCHLDEEQKGFLKPVLNDTTRLSNLSKDILNTARIDQNRLKINAIETDLDNLISQITSGFEITAKERGNSVAYVPVTRPLPKITLDQSKISEVLQNLLSNANKFTENGKILVSAKVQDKYVVVSVSDTGMGINAEDQKHLFQKFYQAGRFDPDNPQEQQGSGLGLYISRSIVELHGGKMWLESTDGKGATFYFSLPLEYHEVVMPSKLHIDEAKLRVL